MRGSKRSKQIKRFVIRFFAAAAAVSAVTFAAGCDMGKSDGAVYLEKEQYEKAAKSFEKDIKKGESLAESYLGLGMARFELGQYDKSLDALKSAVSCGAKKTADLCSMMAASYAKTEDYENALKFYEEALDLKDCTKSLRREILGNEISVLTRMSEWEKARKLAERYVKEYPDDYRIKKTLDFLETR